MAAENQIFILKNNIVLKWQEEDYLSKLYDF